MVAAIAVKQQVVVRASPSLSTLTAPCAKCELLLSEQAVSSNSKSKQSHLAHAIVADDAEDDIDAVNQVLF